MLDVSHLLLLADRYILATGTRDVTLSFWVFADSKKLNALRGGAGITVDRFNAAFRWFSDNWPEATPWPADVERPQQRTTEVAE